MKNEELTKVNACHFCGSTETSIVHRRIDHNRHQAYIRCEKCHACGPDVIADDGITIPVIINVAIDCWNGSDMLRRTVNK